MAVCMGLLSQNNAADTKQEPTRKMVLHRTRNPYFCRRSLFMKKALKFFVISLSLLIVLFLAAAIIVPYMYRDKIPGLVKKELNDNLEAVVDFNGVSLSLFTHFPHLSVSVAKLSIRGKGPFKEDTLVSAHSVDLSLDLMKAINGKFDILKVFLDHPRIHAIVHRNGAANWDITKPSHDTAKSPATSFKIRLRKYEIKNGFVDYHDQKEQIQAIVEGLDHEGSGDFSNTEFELKTKTEIKAFTFFSGKIPYCSNINTKIDLNLQINNNTHKFSFDTKEIKVNGLQLSSKGFIELKNAKNTLVNLEFNAPGNDFKDFLSLVPGIYQASFKDIKTTGHATINGRVRGTYNDHEIPEFEVNIMVADASLQYPDLPQKIDHVQFSLKAMNPDGIPDHTVVSLDKGHIDFGTEPLDFSLRMRNPVTDQFVEAFAKGRLDLSKLGQFIKLDPGIKLSGIINANVAVKGSAAKAGNSQYDSLDANGEITIENLSAITTEMKNPVLLKSMKLTFSPENVALSDFEASFLDTRITCDGSLHNLLGYYLHKGTLSGNVNLVADHINGNKWKKNFTTPPTKPKDPTPAVEQPYIAPSKLDITLSAAVDEIEYDHVKIKSVQGKMHLGDERIDLADVQAHALEGEVVINGFYSTLMNKVKPELNFEYVVSLGRLVVLRRHLDHL